MAEKLYYDENIFYLNEIITTIENGSKLEIDSGLYLDKIVDDILFIESTLARLYGSLMENAMLIRRSEHLRRLLRSKQQFCDVLADIVGGNSSLSSNLNPFFPKFNELISEQKRHIEEIHDLFSASATGTEQPEDLVSPEEYRILMEDNAPDA